MRYYFQSPLAERFRDARADRPTPTIDPLAKLTYDRRKISKRTTIMVTEPLMTATQGPTDRVGDLQRLLDRLTAPDLTAFEASELRPKLFGLLAEKDPPVGPAAGAYSNRQTRRCSSAL